ncbi:MAG: HAMP domain-containing sensor histidine kinase, partial [Pseudomonadota bacterium]
MASSFRGWSGLDWFIPPDQRSSAIDVFRGRAITATTLFAGISFGAVSLFRAVAAEASFEWVLAVTFFSALLIVAPFLYRYTGSTRIVTGIVLVSGIFGAPLVGYYAGFFPAPVMLAFPLLPLAIALLENLRMTVIATGGAIAGILYLYFSLAQQGDQSQAFVVVSIGMTILVGGLGVAYERVLRHSFEELNDVTEQLRRTGATARDANAAKSEFLARMSHEIRTPLTVIMALGSLHADRREIPEELRADFEAIKAAADSLNVLVNNALDMAGIEELELQLRPTAFEPWFNEISAGLQAIARQQEVSLGVSLRRPCPVNVSIDAAKLNQVLTNLVLNAVKHTSADSSVLVCVEAAGGVLELSVRDFGAGFTTDDVDQLFEAFEIAETEEAAGAG